MVINAHNIRNNIDRGGGGSLKIFPYFLGGVGLEIFGILLKSMRRKYKKIREGWGGGGGGGGSIKYFPYY